MTATFLVIGADGAVKIVAILEFVVDAGKRRFVSILFHKANLRLIVFGQSKRSPLHMIGRRASFGLLAGLKYI